MIFMPIFFWWFDIYRHIINNYVFYFIFESRDTGEYEPNEDGDPVPIMEMDLHQYADMLILKQGLDEETYDKVRKCLGLDPLRQAAAAGSKITDKIRRCRCL